MTLLLTGVAGGFLVVDFNAPEIAAELLPIMLLSRTLSVSATMARMHAIMIALLLLAQEKPEEKLRTANGKKLAETVSAISFSLW